MSLAWLAAGFAAVAAWFLGFELIERRLVGEPGPGFRAPWPTYLADALLFTLFASLWFASLGHGGWVLLFLLLGLLLEGAARYRDQPTGFDRSRIKRMFLGTIRVVVAGALLSLIL
ncbi:MAG: hypothetical protein ABI836_09885 [Gemmatimonadota bacterium]